MGKQWVQRGLEEARPVARAKQFGTFEDVPGVEPERDERAARFFAAQASRRVRFTRTGVVSSPAKGGDIKPDERRASGVLVYRVAPETMSTPVERAPERQPDVTPTTPEHLSPARLAARVDMVEALNAGAGREVVRVGVGRSDRFFCSDCGAVLVVSGECATCASRLL